MKNAFKNSKSKSKNFVKRVLSKTSSLNASDPSMDKSLQMEEERPPINVEMELFSLKKQIDGLQKSVNTMQYDNEKKEAALAKLARDKEQLHVDLNKQKRSNTNLKQQLEDERKFYYKEKEQYCIEMTETKKLKQKLHQADNDASFKEISRQKEDALKKEIDEHKERLNVTLEANYNLSVKFLRMKNTKFCLKNRLKRLQTEHNVAMEEFKDKLDKVELELSELVQKEFMFPITPSSKKYLQIIKYNGQLIHENLALQQQTERLQLHLDKIKTQQVREETNEKLQYYNNRSRSEGAVGSRQPNQREVNRRKNVSEARENEDRKRENKKKAVDSKETRCPSSHSSPHPRPKTPLPLRTSPSLDIQTLYERNTAFVATSPPSSITIQPLDNSRAVNVTLAAGDDSVANLQRLCRRRNVLNDSDSEAEADIDTGQCCRSVGDVESAMDLLQVSNCTSNSNQNTEGSFYTTTFPENRPQSAPAEMEGIKTVND